MNTVIALAIRIIAAGALVSLFVFTSYQWGRNACRAAYEAANAKIRSEHAEAINRAERAATERALARQEKDLTNEERIVEIVRAAAQEPEAAAECVSVGTVERLRELQ